MNAEHIRKKRKIYSDRKMKIIYTKKMQNILKCTLHVCKTLQNVFTLVKIDVLVNEKKVTQ